MATEVLVGLSREAREVGWSIFDWLKSEEVPLKALFWKADDYGYWRLYVVTPVVDQVGALQIYMRLNRFLRTLTDEQQEAVDSSDVAIISPHRMVVAEVRRRYGKVSPDRESARRTRTDPDEAYVYVME